MWDKIFKGNFCIVLVKKFWIKSGLACKNLTGSCQVAAQKWFWVHLPQICILGPSPHVRLNFKKKKKNGKVLVIKFWKKWGVVCKNLTDSCQVAPQKSIWAHLPQIYMLGFSPHVSQNLKKKKKFEKCWSWNVEQNEGLFVKIWQVVAKCRLKNNFGLVCPKSLY